MDRRTRENRRRKGVLKKNETVENTLGTMNAELEKNHHRLVLDLPELNSFPFLFVCGLPRSGTTLLMQTLSQCLDVGYIDNLIARFWSAPLYGITLSKTLLKERSDKDQGYTSFWGKTKEIHGPHEFSYFWHQWFHPHDCADGMGIDLEKIVKTTDWQGLRKMLLNMAHYFNNPLLLKGIWPSYFLDKFIEILPHSLFIFISRKEEDVALSLYRTRLKYYETPDTWWSMYPAEYKKLKDLPWYEQIAGQMFYLNRCYSRQIERVDKKNILFIDYKELCDSPPKVLEAIRARVEANFSYSVDIIRKPPDHFKISGYDKNSGTREYALLREALKKFKQKEAAVG